jgi:hypothetical protein
MTAAVDAKTKFLLGEFALMSINAALATRNKRHPVYAESAEARARAIAKCAIYRTLRETAAIYIASPVEEHEHLVYIEKTSNRLSMELGDTLFSARFRIGISQKLINLYLKYLWTSGHCQEPPHCPIDGIIRDRAKISYDWTENDSINDYKQAVANLRHVAGDQSLSIWELAEFGRRQSEL